MFYMHVSAYIVCVVLCGKMKGNVTEKLDTLKVMEVQFLEGCLHLKFQAAFTLVVNKGSKSEPLDDANRTKRVLLDVPCMQKVKYWDR